MTEKQAQRNVRLYFWYRIFFEPLFWGAIIIAYIQRASGMSLSEICFMESVCIVVSIALQVPTGALADLAGRKKIVIIGYSLMIIMLIIFASADNRLMIWAANLCCFAGISFCQGADSAFFYDSLKFLQKTDEHRKILSRCEAGKFYLAAVCSVAAGYLAEIDIRLPLWLSLPTLIFNWFLLFGFTETPIVSQEKAGAKEHFNLMKMSVLFVANHQRVKWLIAFFALIAVVAKLWFFTYNPYFDAVGLPLSRFGWIFGLLNLVAGISSHFTERIHHRLGDKKSIAVIMALSSLPIIAMGALVCPAAAFLVIAQNFVRGYMNPFMTDFLQRYLDSRNRATMESVKATVVAASQLVSLLVFAQLLKIFSLPACLEILGVFALVGGGWLFVSYQRIFER